MDTKLISTVKNCELFHKMSEEELIMLLDCLKPRIRKFTRKSIVNAEGDHFEGIGIVLSGQVAVIREDLSGNRTMLALLKPGDLFGEMAAFGDEGRWPATIAAQSACSVMYMPPDKILGQCEKVCTWHRTLIMNMLGILSRKARALNKKLEYLSIKNMRDRIARFLIEQFEKHGQTTFLLQMNRNELADFLNVSRTSLSRELCRMRDEGLLDFHRSSIQLKDINRLKQ